MVDAGHEVTGVHLALSSTLPRPVRGRAGAAAARTPGTHDASPIGSRSRSTSGTSRNSSPPTSSTTSSPSTPLAAPPTRAYAATSASSSPQCSTGRSRWAMTPCAPGTTPDSSRLPTVQRRPCIAPPTRPKTSPTCLRCSRPSSWRTRCSLSVTTSRRRCGSRPSRAGCRWPRSPTATTSASSPTATRPGSCSVGSARRLGRSSTRAPASRSARTPAPSPSPSASAAGCASTPRHPTAVRGTC